MSSPGASAQGSPAVEEQRDVLELRCRVTVLVCLLLQWRNPTATDTWGHLERMGILAAYMPIRSIVKKVEAGVEGSRGCGEVLPPGWLI